MSLIGDFVDTPVVGNLVVMGTLFKYSVGEGVRYFADPPQRLSLGVCGIKRSPDSVSLDVVTPRSALRKLQYGEGNATRHKITVNLQNGPVLDRGNTGWWLLDDWRRGDIGQAAAILYSLPLTLPLSPLLLGINFYYKVREYFWGHSRHHQALLNALKGQIDARTEKDLRAAMARDWRREKAGAPRVTAGEAADLLAQCRLFAVRFHDDGFPGWSNWYDRGNGVVATDNPSGFQVLGRIFKDDGREGDEALKLKETYRSRITLHYSFPRGDGRVYLVTARDPSDFAKIRAALEKAGARCETVAPDVGLRVTLPEIERNYRSEIASYDWESLDVDGEVTIREVAAEPLH